MLRNKVRKKSEKQSFSDSLILKWYAIVIFLPLFLVACSKTEQTPMVNESVYLGCIGELNALNLSLNSIRYDNTNNESCECNNTLAPTIVYNYNCSNNSTNTSNSYVIGLIKQIKRYERQLENNTFYNESQRNKALKGNLTQCKGKLDDIGDIIIWD